MNRSSTAEDEGLDYATLDALRGDDDDYEGPLDHPCPLCGPDRSTEYNQMRPVLRTWRLSPVVISYKCARCDVQGAARFDPMSAYLPQPPLPEMPLAKKPARSVDLHYVERLWREASEVLPASVIAYFRWRRIPLDELPPGVLRFHPAVPWGPWKKSSDKAAPKVHGLLARYSDAVTGELRGIWRRPIISNQRRKDPILKPIALGPIGGCVIRLFPIAGKRLVIAEGIETAYTAALHVSTEAAAASMGDGRRGQHGAFPRARWHRATDHHCR
jgi:hypothetical protein